MNSGSILSSIGRRQADVRPVFVAAASGLRRTLLPAVPADARDGRPASDPATGLPGQPYRLGRWPQFDAAHRSSTATRPRSSAEHFAPTYRASPPSGRHARFRKTGNSATYADWPQKPLNNIVVYGNPPVAVIADEGIPTVQHIVDRLGQFRRGPQRRPHFIETGLHPRQGQESSARASRPRHKCLGYGNTGLHYRALDM